MLLMLLWLTATLQLYKMLSLDRRGSQKKEEVWLWILRNYMNGNQREQGKSCNFWENKELELVKEMII